MRPLIFGGPAQQALSCLRTPGSRDPTAVLSRCYAASASALAHQGQIRGGVVWLALREIMQVRIVILHPVMVQECARCIIVV